MFGEACWSLYRGRNALNRGVRYEWRIPTIEEGRGAANDTGVVSVVGLYAVVFLVVKGVNPMDGWLYLSQEDVDSLPICGRSEPARRSLSWTNARVGCLRRLGRWMDRWQRRRRPVDGSPRLVSFLRFPWIASPRYLASTGGFPTSASRVQGSVSRPQGRRS